MKLRPIEEGDRAQVLAMMTELYNSPALLHPSPTSVLNKDIDDCISDIPYIDGYVMEASGAVVGYTMVSKGYSTERGGISIMIEDLFVKKEYRGKGYGSRALCAIEEIYKDGAVRLRLEVEPNNTRAAKLYAEIGYDDLPYRQMVKELG